MRSVNPLMTARVPPLDSRLVLGRLHLIRHGEVLNPDRLVYADLAGFHLGERGRAEAAAIAAYLAAEPIEVIAVSPLERAVESAAPLAARLGLPLLIDDRLTEWRLLNRWAGVVWEDLAVRFPGEVEAYLTHAADLAFSPESLDAVATRLAAVVDDLGRAHPHGVAAVVSHQDPIQALRLALTGRPLADLPIDKPRHGAVLTLEAGEPWTETSRWHPPAPV